MLKKLLVAAMLFTTPAVAADFAVVDHPDGSGNKAVHMVGEVSSGDFYRMQNLIKSYEQELGEGYMLIVNSPGGSGSEMKKISQFVIDNNLDTGVGPGRECFSACAVIWASGNNKTMFEDSMIGFHVSSFAWEPQTIEMVNSIKDGYGWASIQMLFQEKFREDLKYYRTLPVADPDALVLGIALEGATAYEFFFVTPTNSDIIGKVTVK